MNDLSTPSQGDGIQSQTSQPAITVTPTGAKEAEPGGIHPVEGLRDATGQEFEPSAEVTQAGVKVHPTTVPIPRPVAQMGVQPAGQNIPVQTTPTVVLPLTDDQIAAGLHASVTNSIRWLAAWCVKRMKQLHIAIKVVHGKLIRVSV